MSTSIENFYAANVNDFTVIKVCKEEWESKIKTLEDTTCVHWNNRGFIAKEGGNTKRRSRTNNLVE